MSDLRLESSLDGGRHGGIAAGVFAVLALAAIGLTRLYSFLLFHSLAELFSVVIALGIFMLVWHSRRITNLPYFLFIGVWGLATAVIDVLHVLAFQGMGVFSGDTSNLATQLWIAGRWIDCLSLFAAPFFIGRKLKPHLLLTAAALVLASVLFLIFATNLFPDMYVAGKGLTPLKKISEYAISGIFVLAAVNLAAHRKAFDARVFGLLIAMLALKAAAEVTFTLYVGVNDGFNMVGHMIRVVARAFLYMGVVSTGFEKPYRLLFLDLKRHEEELASALSKVKQLSGLLPICAGCKKIRNDLGYWEQIEAYISEHSQAEFSHGLCPECARRLYPEYADREEEARGS